MQIVIEIPKELYIACEKLCKTHHLSRVEDAIGKGIPLSEHHGKLFDSVLDEIRAEINKLPDLNPDYEMDKTIHVSKWAVFDIIDKHRNGESE